MAFTSQPEVFLTEEAQKIKSQKNWKKTLIVIALILLLLASTVLIMKYQNRLKIALDNLLSQLKPSDQFKGQTEPQIKQIINKEQKTGEFYFAEPSPIDNSEIVSEQQAVVEGTFDSTNNKIVIKNISTQELVKHLGSVPIAPSIPWIIIETTAGGRINYSTRFPLLYREGQSTVPFMVNLPYLKQFDLNIYNQNRKLLFSQAVQL